MTEPRITCPSCGYGRGYHSDDCDRPAPAPERPAPASDGTYVVLPGGRRVYRSSEAALLDKPE